MFINHYQYVEDINKNGVKFTRQLKNGDKIKKGDTIAWVFMPDMITYGTGYGPNFNEAEELACINFLAKNGDSLSNFCNQKLRMHNAILFLKL